MRKKILRKPPARFVHGSQLPNRICESALSASGFARRSDAFGLIAARKDRFPPRLVTQIPGHGLRKPAFKRLRRAPAELTLVLRRIDRIASVFVRVAVLG